MKQKSITFAGGKSQDHMKQIKTRIVFAHVLLSP